MVLGEEGGPRAALLPGDLGLGRTGGGPGCWAAMGGMVVGGGSLTSDLPLRCFVMAFSSEMRAEGVVTVVATPCVLGEGMGSFVGDRLFVVGVATCDTVSGMGVDLDAKTLDVK